MDHLELVWTREREPPDLEAPETLTSAKIWNCRYRSLDWLAECCNLGKLEVLWFPDDNLHVLPKLAKLVSLKIVHLPKVRDLEPIARMKRLEDLELSTAPSWDASGKRQIVRSIEPISRIGSLRRLTLMGVVPADGSLRPLWALTNLETGMFHGYPDEELHGFKEATGLDV